MARPPAPALPPGPGPAMGAPPPPDMALDTEGEDQGPEWTTLATLQTNGQGEFRLLEGDEPEPTPADPMMEDEGGPDVGLLDAEPGGLTVGFEGRGELLNRISELMEGDAGAEGGGPLKKAFDSGYNGDAAAAKPAPKGRM